MIAPDLKSIALATALCLAGCKAGGLTPNSKAQATQEWNHARADAMASLAADQLKEGNFEKCQETVGKALEMEPNNAGLHLLAAKVSLEQNKLDVAETHLAAAQKLDPTNAEPDYLSGVVLQRWQQPEQARQAYAKAAAKNPGELSYLLAEAEMLVTLDQTADALALLQSNVAKFEHSGVLRDAIGQLLAQQDKFDDAAVALRDASRLSGDDSTIREHLAFALLSAKRYAEAGDVFERLTQDGDYDKRADVRAALGECQSQSGRPADAQKSYAAATQLNPSCAGYWVGLARVTVQTGDLPSADVAVRRAVSLDPASSGAQCLLGLIRLKQNQLPQALAAFEAAAALDPHDSVSVSLQGYLFAHTGRKADAEKCYARALALNPQDPLAKQWTVASTAGE